MKLEDHPTVRHYHQTNDRPLEAESPRIHVGKAKSFGLLWRVAPKAAQRILRDQ